MAKTPKWALIVSAVDTIPWIILAYRTEVYVVLCFDAMMLCLTLRAIKEHWHGQGNHHDLQG